MTREDTDIVKQFLISLDIYINGFLGKIDGVLKEHPCSNTANYVRVIRENEERYLMRLREDILATDVLDRGTLVGRLHLIARDLIRVRGPAESLCGLKDTLHTEEFEKYVGTLDRYEEHIDKLISYINKEVL